MTTPGTLSIEAQDAAHAASRVALRHGLDPALVCAVCEQESRWEAWAWNPEPRYRWMWDVHAGRPFRSLSDAEIASERPPADFPTLAGDRDQEWWAQQASWGLMQVMGAVARERGYRGAWVPRLCDPEVGLEYGCRHLVVLLARHSGDVRLALLSYNGGGNPRYADEVLARLARYQAVAAEPVVGVPEDAKTV